MKLILILLLVSVNAYALSWDGNKQLNKTEKRVDQYLNKIEALIAENNRLKIKLSNVTSESEVKKLEDELEKTRKSRNELSQIVEKQDAVLKTLYEDISVYEKERAPPSKELEHYVNNCMAMWTGNFNAYSIAKAKESCIDDAEQAFAEFKLLKKVDKAGNWKQIPNYADRKEKFEKLSVYFK